MKNDTDTQPTFALSDFYLAAYLICRGMELLKADPTGSNRITFILTDHPVSRPAYPDPPQSHQSGLPLTWGNLAQTGARISVDQWQELGDLSSRSGFSVDEWIGSWRSWCLGS